MKSLTSNIFSAIIISLLFSVVVLTTGCKSTKPSYTVTRQPRNPDISIFDNIVKSKNVSALMKEMTGTFTTAKQAAEDTSYFDITLSMHPIWKSNKTAKFLYVEQAVTSQINEPYRQRIYKILSDGNGGFESHIYELDKEERYIGRGKDTAFFDQFDESIMAEREGCTVYLNQHADGSYSGSTRLDHCKSDFRGASYATSIVKIRPNNIMSWDQGFDAAGVQIWGAKKGGYRFVRVGTK